MIPESVAKFLCDNIGNQLSTIKVANTMTSDDRKVDQKNAEKYYAIDIGFRYMLLGKCNTYIGHKLEGLVYLEPLHRDYNVDSLQKITYHYPEVLSYS